ncbi:MAG: PadR family transcriptional regulator [Actinobacteria bacterium]|nr:PadR family transcriptional regulator [Actinomycetota bacterium]
MAAIREWMADISTGALTVEDRSLYRALQRFHDSELVKSTSVAGNRGPDRKLYELNPIGERVLSALIERDIRLLLKPEVVRLLEPPA